MQFSLPGAVSGYGGAFAAAGDENTFVFEKQNDLAEKVKKYIETRGAELRKGGGTKPSRSVSEELEHLVELRKSGVLTEDEFQSAKKRLLA